MKLKSMKRQNRKRKWAIKNPTLWAIAVFGKNVSLVSIFKREKHWDKNNLENKYRKMSLLEWEKIKYSKRSVTYGRRF